MAGRSVSSPGSPKVPTREGQASSPGTPRSRGTRFPLNSVPETGQNLPTMSEVGTVFPKAARLEPRPTPPGPRGRGGAGAAGTHRGGAQGARASRGSGCAAGAGGAG